MLGAIHDVTDQIQGLAKARSGGLGDQVQSLRRQFTGMSSSSVSLAGLAGKMQQEAARQDMDRQKLAAQQVANEHLGALAGAAGGSGLRVQVVGNQPGQW